MNDCSRLSDHEEFEELAALANSGTLTAGEWSELKRHLQVCKDCRKLYHQYQILAREGMPLLAARYSNEDGDGFRYDIPAPTKLLARIRDTQAAKFHNPAHRLLRRTLVHPLVRVGIAACFTIAVGAVSYRLGGRTQSRVNEQYGVVAENVSRNKAAEEKEVLYQVVDNNSEKLGRLKQEIAQREQNLTALREAMRVLTDRANDLAIAKSTTDEQLESILGQRDALTIQLRDAEQLYENARAELVNVRTERDKAVSRSASDQSRIDELSAVNLDFERRIRNDEQYLASDRDIRELMGARKLYIADVFDVDGHSHTQKRFGRVFYTQGKSLVFYAFDLDLQPDLRNGSTFQAWGRRDADSKEPLNLGIFYIDSESSRRWALRFDDPKELAEIDSVFVTAEPRGGSQKPTGKPFLYALLRGEANHP
jgi:hypothetical protein